MNLDLKRWLAFLFLFLNLVLPAQQPAFFILGEEEFRGVQIYDVIQDKELNYWFATNEGVYCYDYYNYKKTECDKAKSSSVFNFVINKEGTIYCHNLNNQVFQIRDKKFELFYELKNDETSTDISLSVSDNDHLVVGAKGIIVLDKNANVLLHYPVRNHYLGPAFRADNESIHFNLGASDSVLVYSQNTATKHKLSMLSAQTSTDFVLKFFKMKEKIFAVDLKNRNYYEYKISDFSLTQLPRNQVFEKEGHLRVYETGNESWIAGTLPGVSFLSDVKPHTGNSFFYKDYFISDVFKDNEGNFLLSTFNKGIIVVPDLKVPDVINSFREDPVTSLYSDSGPGLFLGFSKGKIMSYNNGSLQLISDKGVRPIEAIYGSLQSDLILFDNGFIRAYNKRTAQIVDVDGSSLKDAAFVSKNEIYLGTNKGVVKVLWDGKNKFSSEYVEGLRNRIYSVEYDPKNNCMYASTARGLIVVLPSGTIKKVTYGGEDVFPNDLYYYNGNVYVSSRKNGLLVIKEGKVVKAIQPFVNDSIEVLDKLLVKDNYIIANSSNGFFQFDMEGKLLKQIHSTFGFSSTRVLDFTFHNGFLWVSHLQGVQQIDLNYSKLNAVAPTVFFKKILVNDERVNVHQQASLNSGQRKIQFIFSCPTLRNRETIQYHYKLVGYETQWNVNDYASNSITYNALAPGSYTLQLKAGNDGLYSGISEYRFSIAMPFYLRWWFITCIVFLFLLIVYVIYRWQLKIQQKKSQQVNELNASKLTAIQSQMNPHFIFNSLNSIQDLILKGDVEHSYSYITTFSNLVRRTLNYSEKDFVDFEQEIKLLELYLSLEKLRFKKDLTYTLEYKNTDDIMIPPLLIQPFVENALVHGLLHKEGEKILKISFELNEVLICVIEDNGVGREKARAIKQRQKGDHESFSGKAIKKRFEILSNVFKGSFSYAYEDLYQGNEPVGTKVILTIPVKHKY